MTTYNTDVETVLTHAQLGDEIGGTNRLEDLLSRQQAADSSAVRTKALRDVLKFLGARTPPIYEADLQDVTELREAVAYNALWRLYREAMTTANDVYAEKAKHFMVLWKAEVKNLRVTLAGGSAGAPNSITLTRR